MERQKKKAGGFRPGSGRHRKLDKDEWGKITCILKKETIAKLRAGAKSEQFGRFLQFHLERYPVPDRETYLALTERVPVMVQTKRRRRVAALVSMGDRPVRIRRSRNNKRPLSKKEFEEAIIAAG